MYHHLHPLESFITIARDVIKSGEANIITYKAHIEIQFYVEYNTKWAKSCVHVFTILGVILTTFMPGKG